jgi:hypothetical protein
MDISQYITPVSGLQYFIVMVDFGRGRGKPSGFGANVEPEMSRREIVEEVRDCIANGRQIVHVKLVCGNDMHDVTHEILSEALAGIEPEPVDLRAISFDHARDLRKHEVAQ